MKSRSLFGVVTVAVILAVSAFAMAGEHHKSSEHQHLQVKVGSGGVTADQALNGIPMVMTPQQLPAQFRSQIRSDASESRGVAILKQEGADIHYTFAWFNLTSPVISAHFHKAPEGSVGARAYSICGVAGESPACPTGTTNSISGVWKSADATAVQQGGITIAFHTEVYPAPIGEIAVYIPASRNKAASLNH